MDDSIPTSLATDRLNLTQASLFDAEEVFASYASSPEVTRYLTWSPHRDVVDTVAYLERVNAWWREGSQYNWMIRTQAEQRIVGSIGVRNQGTTHQVGYVLAQDAWGQGFMTEALRAVMALSLSMPAVYRFEGLCYVGNEASARVMTKAGMHYEGTLRRYIDLPNLGSEPADAKCFAVVR
ncbi:MAG: GNAT family N-acetyltransferase [Pseudomonadota bacterium]